MKKVLQSKTNCSSNNDASLSDKDEDDDFDDTCFLSSDKQIKCLEDLPWFHHGMTRNTAEALLLACGAEGTYLMRNSQNHPGKYTISVRCQDSSKHYSLELDRYNNIYLFGIGKFDSLHELIEHFKFIPILGGETGLSVTLKHPYVNNIPEPSSYEKVSRHAEFPKGFPIEKGSTLNEPDLHIASKEGYLIKRGGIHKNWKKRWFVVQKNLLKYYAERFNTLPIRTIDLIRAIHVTEDFCDGKKNCFRLSLPERVFYFAASSSDEARSWIEILQWKIDYYKDRKIEDTSSIQSKEVTRTAEKDEHASYIAQYTKL